MHLKLKQFFIYVFQIKPALYSVTFILSLFVLLLNDFLLKNAFSNTLTGKLSDFCGLYAFAFFFSQIFPANKKLAIHIITAVIFILWKSPLSDSFISVFSTYVFTIDRVVDYSDLWALIVLPLSYFKNGKSFDSSYKTIGLSFVALIAFASTSQPSPRFTFFEPQYVLVKTSIPVQEQFGENKNIKMDSLTLVRITEVGLNKYPELNDDFQQKYLLENLEKIILYEYDSLRKSSETSALPSNYYSEQIHIVYKEDSCQEKLSFLNGRLHGAYIRSIHEQNIVSGYYKFGIPDSTWTYYTHSGSIDKEDIYVNGEKAKSIHYRDGESTSSSFILSRHNKKTIAIALFVVMIVVFFASIYFLSKEYKKATRKISVLETILYSILSSIISVGITSVLVLNAPTGFFQAISIQFLFFIFACPLFFIVYLAIDRHSIKTFLLIILLYSMLILLLQDYIIIRDLKNVSEIDFFKN